MAVAVRDGRLARGGEPWFPVGVNYHPGSVGVAWLRSWRPAEVAADLAAMAGAGLDCVRAFAYWADIEPSEGRHDPVVIDRLRTFGALAAAEGLGVVLSVPTVWMNGHRFLPPWFGDRDPWRDPVALARAEAAVGAVAGALAGSGADVLYDLGDEVMHVDPRSRDLDRDEVVAWQSRLADAARDAHPGAVVLQANEASAVFARHAFGPDNAAGLDLCGLHGFPLWAPPPSPATPARWPAGWCRSSSATGGRTPPCWSTRSAPTRPGRGGGRPPAGHAAGGRRRGRGRGHRLVVDRRGRRRHPLRRAPVRADHRHGRRRRPPPARPRGAGGRRGRRPVHLGAGPVGAGPGGAVPPGAGPHARAHLPAGALPRRAGAVPRRCPLRPGAAALRGHPPAGAPPPARRVPGGRAPDRARHRRPGGGCRRGRHPARHPGRPPPRPPRRPAGGRRGRRLRARLAPRLLHPGRHHLAAAVGGGRPGRGAGAGRGDRRRRLRRRHAGPDPPPGGRGRRRGVAAGRPVRGAARRPRPCRRRPLAPPVPARGRGRGRHRRPANLPRARRRPAPGHRRRPARARGRQPHRRPGDHHRAGPHRRLARPRGTAPGPQVVGHRARPAPLAEPPPLLAPPAPPVGAIEVAGAARAITPVEEPILDRAEGAGAVGAVPS